MVGNESGGLGGGIYLEGCELSLVGPVTVSSNRARIGGGIAADGADVGLRGTVEGPVRVIGNIAEDVPGGIGGGIAIRGAGAELMAENARIDDNRALPETETGGVGGGLAVEGFAVARLDRTLGAACPGGAACSSLSGNRAGSSAAALVGASSRLEIRRTAVHSNVALGAVIRGGTTLNLPRSELVLEGASLTANSGRTLIGLEGRFRLDVVFSSAAGNLGLDRVIRATGDSGGLPGQIEIAGSILYDPPVDPEDEMFDLDPEVGFDADFVVVPEEAMVPVLQLFNDGSSVELYSSILFDTARPESVGGICVHST